MNGFELIEAEIESQVEPGTEIPYLWLFACKRGFGPRKPRKGAKVYCTLTCCTEHQPIGVLVW